MKKYEFRDPIFVKTVLKSEHYPRLFSEDGRPMSEVAVAGRSNVGKSTLINHLFRHRKMARTSSTPGKTQALNFFTLDGSLAFTDLPGYGFAKVPEKIRKSWGPMIQSYLENRDHLKVILFLFDIRRMPNDDDRQLLEWIIHNEKSMILVLTKVDKVSKNERKANCQKILRSFGADNIVPTFYSATKNIGRQELIRLINEALQSEEEE
ncbi:MAG: putative GTP-binding protein EngB [Chlamydiae bacterium]|nr:putative GTP-binding protein EngB [Chlamydiota bacterium]